jgi:MtaA/CmuA family methyltransferase
MDASLDLRRLFLDALARRPVPRPPVANPTALVTVGLQDRVGRSFPEGHRDPEAMAELALAGHTVCGYDVVFPVFGAGTHEAEALGAPVDWGDRTRLPVVRRAIWTRPDEIRIPEDFLERAAVVTVLEAIRRLRERVGDSVAIIGKVYGPWSLAYLTFGLQSFLMATIKSPSMVDEILARLVEVTVRFGRAQIEAGADALTVGEHITGDLIAPQAYPRFLLEHDQRLARELKVPLILHCCGKTLDRVEHFERSGMAAFHFESVNDPRLMRERCRRMALVGNVNNARTLRLGTPHDVRREVHRALEAGVDVIAPECAIPLDVPLENLVAVREAVAEHSARGG